MPRNVNNFTIDELVCPHVLKLHGDKAWDWMDNRLRTFLEWFRPAIGKPVYVNNYMHVKKNNLKIHVLDERGLRCNLCDLVKSKTLKNIGYNSAHIRFQAIDFNVEGMKDSDVIAWLEAHKSEIPVPIRIERDTDGWIHIDVCNTGSSKIEYFNA